MALTPEELERYKRHILLPEVGGQGQQKLRGACIIVIGAGGIGCPLLQYLAAAGIGQIDLYDDDLVDLSNLQRQVLFTTGDIGRPKVEAAAAHLKALNPDVTVRAFQRRVKAAADIEDLADADALVEGVDNFETRFVLNRVCRDAEVPFLSAAVGRFDGQLALFRGWEEDAPCYQCFVPEEPPEAADCELEGVLGPLPGVIGTLAALEALKIVTGFASPAAGSVLIFDGRTGIVRQAAIRRDPACEVCGEN